MNIGYLGAGTWGFALAYILALNGHFPKVWARDVEFVKLLQKTRRHPKLGDFEMPKEALFTSNISEAVEGADVIVESITSSGFRPVFEKLLHIEVPVIITSKGIEQKTGLLLPEALSSIWQGKKEELIGVLSGPSHAEDIITKAPTSVVCSGYGPSVMKLIQDLFTTPTLRIYPNADMLGVCFGGAMKNIIAIACGLSDGLGCGDNTKAALMTRGLHEIKKLSGVKKCQKETLNGLSGMGDLCVTCMSKHSRNYRFGRLIAEGLSPEGARQKIGMTVEGVYTCVSARELAMQHHIAVPITEVIYQIIYEGLDPREAAQLLLQRVIKEEHL